MVSSGLADHGYQYVNIDDCWAVKPGAKEPDLQGAERDAQGRVNTNARFPDMKALTDHIHGLGLKAGIYTSPGPEDLRGPRRRVPARGAGRRPVRRVGLRLPEVRLVLVRRDRRQGAERRGPPEAVPADGRDPEAPAPRRRPQPLPVRDGEGLGVGARGRRPQLADRGRPGPHLRGHRHGPLQGRLRRLRRRRAAPLRRPRGLERPRLPAARLPLQLEGRDRADAAHARTSSTRTSRSGRSSPPRSSSAAT